MTKKCKEIVKKEDDSEVSLLIESRISEIRPELQTNPYIIEAIKVLPVQGYRSAIGSIWNAVVDDLRNKVIHRSLSLFNKEMKDRIGKECKTYEDFQNINNDDILIEGAYKIGVIGWEAQKVLKHAKETRHIFYGHPKSSDPSVFKVLSMLEDCIKYVLKEEYPLQIIDIDEYIKNMETASYDRNPLSIEYSIGDLPEIYKTELINKLFNSYIDLTCSTVLRSNIEFCAPHLWKFLNNQIKLQIVRKLDSVIGKSNSDEINFAFQFIETVGAQSSLSIIARKYKVEPLIDKLEANLDVWSIENECVKELSRYSDIIPSDLISRYVNSLTQTYVGVIGNSAQYSRTDFYADGAALYIPDMFEKFDDSAVDSFLDSIRNNKALRDRITNPRKLRRLRSLANVLLGRISEKYHDRLILETLVDESKEEKFLKMLQKKTT